MRKVFRRIGNAGIPTTLKRVSYWLCGYKIGKGVKIHRTVRIYAQSASIGDYSDIGEDVLVRGLKDFNVGEFTNIGMGTSIEGDSSLEIGDNCYIGSRSAINVRAPVTINDNVALGGYYTQIWTHSTWPEEVEGYKVNKKAKVERGKNAYIGAGSIILPGVKLGENAIVGAGSVVTKDVEKNIVSVGAPAKKISNISAYKGKVDKRKRIEAFVAGKKEIVVLDKLSQKGYNKAKDEGAKAILVVKKVDGALMKRSTISIFDFENKRCVIRNNVGVSLRRKMNDFFARFKGI